MLISISILLSDKVVADASLQVDREVLLQLKFFLRQNNRVEQGHFIRWGAQHSPCSWSGITCNDANSRVTGINLSSSGISGSIFGNFSALTELSVLDLSENTVEGTIPSNLSQCKNLRFLNLSHNLLEGELNLIGLNKLEILDVTGNRLQGGIESNFPTICTQLIAANLSSNCLTGGILNCFDNCRKLQVLDLSENQFLGPIWPGFARLRKFSASENNLTGEISPSLFTPNCSLQALDLSVNNFHGEIPKSISNCVALASLNLWGNRMRGKIPPEVGNLSSLEVLVLGQNRISREIPETLNNCRNLWCLDLGGNGFGGDIQEIFGRFEQVEKLVLSGNAYTGGIISSGILKLPKLRCLYLSYNLFSGQLPVEFSKMASLQVLFLAKNHFNGSIPPPFGELRNLRALDLSSNNLTGTIPSTIGNMSSLMWLKLAQNKLTGAIPKEIGNCSRLLWLNLAHNRFTGKIPVELTRIGSNPDIFAYKYPWPWVTPDDCRVMRWWLPDIHPPFSFFDSLLSLKSCRSLWRRLLRGAGLVPVFGRTSDVRTKMITGYLQLTANHFSGELPQDMGEMQHFSVLLLGFNQFTGSLPSSIGRMPLFVLNVSHNGFSGEIPSDLSNITRMETLDLSQNHFSGKFPLSLGRLNELGMFNVSYNPSISGVVPTTGQMAAFGDDSFLGNPKLVRLGGTLANREKTPGEANSHPTSKNSFHIYMVFLASALAFLLFGLLSFILCAILGIHRLLGNFGIFKRVLH